MIARKTNFGLGLQYPINISCFIENEREFGREREREAERVQGDGEWKCV